MEFLKEILKDGYDDFKKAIEKYREAGNVIELADISDGSYILKCEHDEVLKKLKEASDYNLSLESELSEVKEKYDIDTAKLKGDIDEVKFSFALDNAIMSRKPKNLKAVKALIDTNGMVMEDGAIIGIDAQLDKIVNDNGYLFESAMPSSGMRISGGAPSAFDAFSESARKSAGM